MKKSNNKLKILLLTNGLVLSAATMIGPIYALFIEQISSNILLIGTSYAVFSFMGVISSLISGYLSDKYKITHPLIYIGYLLVGVAFLLYIFVSNILTLFVAQIILGIGYGLTDPPFDKEYSKNLEKEKEGSGWASLESMYYLIDGIGALIGGYIVYISSFDSLFILMAGICFASSIIYYIDQK